MSIGNQARMVTSKKPTRAAQTKWQQNVKSKDPTGGRAQQIHQEYRRRLGIEEGRTIHRAKMTTEHQALLEELYTPTWKAPNYYRAVQDTGDAKP